MIFTSIYLKMIVSKTHKQNKHTLAHTLVLLDITNSYSRLCRESHSLIYHLLDSNVPIKRPPCLLFKKPKKSSGPVLSRQQSQKVTSSGLLSDVSAASSVTELCSLNQQSQRRGRARRPRAPQAPSRARAPLQQLPWSRRGLGTTRRHKQAAAFGSPAPQEGCTHKEGLRGPC